MVTKRAASRKRSGPGSVPASSHSSSHTQSAWWQKRRVRSTASSRCLPTRSSRAPISTSRSASWGTGAPW